MNNRPTQILIQVFYYNILIIKNKLIDKYKYIYIIFNKLFVKKQTNKQTTKKITATIRNLVTNEYARSIILKDQIIKSLFLLLNSYSLFNKYEELVLNISRIFR